MISLFTPILSALKAAFAEPTPFEIKPAQGLSVLPMRVVRVKHKPQGKASDMYEIEVQKNRDGKAVSGTFGFHTATAMRQNEGSVPDLTGWDIDALKRGEKPLVGDQRSVRGRTTNTNNAKAKALWHEGADAAQIAKALNLSPSWAEKRHSAFEYALKQERGEQ